MKTYTVGYSSLRFDQETISRLHRYVKLSHRSVVVDNFENIGEYNIDTMLMLNPDSQGPELDKFLEYIREGGTALVLLSVMTNAIDGANQLLNRFGLKYKASRPLARMNIAYTQDYPIKWKQNTNDYFLAAQKKKFTLFDIGKNQGAFKVKPLILNRALISRDNFAVEVEYGTGRIIFIDSSCLPEDRADLLTYLMESSQVTPIESDDSRKTQMKDKILRVLMQSMQVYKEMQIEIIRKKADIGTQQLSDIDLILILEEVIQENKLNIQIQGDKLVSKDS